MPRKKSKKVEEGVAFPNYDIECQNCGERPTVSVRSVRSGFIHNTELCGPCCFGEAACLDPEVWRTDK